MSVQMTEDEKRLVVVQACRAMIEAVKAGGKQGAPGGVMYAALCDKINLSQFGQLMGALVSKGYLRRDGDLYFFVRDL